MSKAKKKLDFPIVRDIANHTQVQSIKVFQ